MSGGMVTRGARAVAWYVTSLMGERAYDHYVAHQRREHPGGEPISEREFWIARYRDQELSPTSGCC